MPKIRRIPFIKMHGAGNDFVFLDRRTTEVSLTLPLIKRLLDRHFGIGGDQLLVLDPGTSVSKPHLQFFNSDGSTAEMCGNGARAAAHYLQTFKGVKKDFSFKTKAGLIYVHLGRKEIEINMGKPVVEGSRIPVKARGPVVNRPLKVGGKTYRIHAVSMGNPHCVIYVPKIQNFPVQTVGPLIENHSFFPKRVNVEFVQILNSGHVHVRVWERGAGETLACGSGACAVAVAGLRIGKTGRQLKLDLPGGRLKTRISPQGEVFLTGPAEVTYSGTFLV